MAKKKMNALDTAIMNKKKLPSKNKKGSIPPDYDVILPGMGYTKPTKKNPPKKITKTNAKPVPMPWASKQPNHKLPKSRVSPRNVQEQSLRLVLGKPQQQPRKRIQIFLKLKVL
ncbi:hypothetical protein EB008_06455 [bacterium]|nr:hypothetical protein [bacterium]